MPQLPALKKTPRRGFFIFLAGVPCLAAIWLGCGIEQAMRDNYVFWNRFIDGIPDPNAPGAEGDEYVGFARDRYKEHTPYAENSCLECHRNPTQSQLSIDDGAICLRCHEEKPTEYARMHGPVAVGACLWCHDPHSSPLPALTRAPMPDLCMQCHAIEGAPGPHADQEAETRACLDCHLGHGSNGAYYLKPGAVLPPIETDDNPVGDSTSETTPPVSTTQEVVGP